MIHLAIPLSKNQLEAAKSLHKSLNQWIYSERAFSLLNRGLPGFSPEASLIKAATLNQLYSTNVFAIGRMALHIAEIMKKPPEDPYSFVSAIASLPTAKNQEIEKRHWSFASKFAHFFVDQKRYHIYDSYANHMVKYHLGSEQLRFDGDNPYRGLVKNLQKLLELANINCLPRDIDIYLWLAGLQQKWLKNKDEAKINVEVRDLFCSRSEVVQRDLCILRGSESK